MANITKRANTYTITVSLGYDGENKQIRKYMTYKPDKSMTDKQIQKELERQAALFESKCLKGLYLDGNITFAEFAAQWFNDYAEKQLKAKTIRGYRIFLKRVNAAIGHVKLDKLQLHHLTQFYNNLKENGIREDTKYKSVIDFKAFLLERNITQDKLSKESGVSIFSIRSVAKGNNINYDTALKISEYFKTDISKLFCFADNKTLSDNTIHHYHTFISSVLTTAVQWQVILSNPCEHVKPPKVTRKEAKFLDENNLEILLDILDNLSPEEEQNKLMIQILLFTGLRKGELCGLKFEDIDFNNRAISVKRNLLYLPEQGIFENTPKTDSSIRTISVSDNIIQLLKNHRISQMRQKIIISDKWNETGYIFTAWFRKLVKKYELPDVSIHSLRHTAATMLLMKGLPVKAVSSRLGHANAVTTSSIYSHALKSIDEKASEIMDDILSGNNKQNKKRHG